MNMLGAIPLLIVLALALLPTSIGIIVVKAIGWTSMRWKSAFLISAACVLVAAVALWLANETGARV